MVGIIQKAKPHAEHYIQEHLHSAQLVAPSGAAPITLTSGGGGWTLGNFGLDFIAADAVANPFDLHWLVVTGADSNVWYEIVLYYGGSDIECCRVAFGRTAVFTSSITVPLMTKVLAASSRVRGKMMDDTGGAVCTAKIFYHTYD